MLKTFNLKMPRAVYGGENAIDNITAILQANPRSGKVYEGIELVRKEGLDFIVALGGGSVIDTAKAIGFGAGTGENISM